LYRFQALESIAISTIFETNNGTAKMSRTNPAKPREAGAVHFEILTKSTIYASEIRLHLCRDYSRNGQVRNRDLGSGGEYGEGGSMMIDELYDALIEAGASETKARAASRAVADMERHFTAIEKAIFGLRAHMDTEVAGLRTHVDKEVTGLRTHVDKEISGLRAHVEKEISGLRAHMDHGLASLRSHVDQQISALRAYVDQQTSTLRAYIDQQLLALRAHVDQELSDLRSHVDQGFLEIRGTLRLHNWMLGTILAFLLAIFFKLFA
jgi:hypothetical protein